MEDRQLVKQLDNAHCDIVAYLEDDEYGYMVEEFEDGMHFRMGCVLS